MPHHKPLGQTRVIDLATGPAGAIGRQLAELGADVILVEPKGGAAERSEEPLVNGQSLNFLLTHRGKRGLSLDVVTEMAEFDRLLAVSDILITARPLDFDRIRTAHPTLVILSVSDFGLDAPFDHWQATDPVLTALTGMLSRSGVSGKPPLIPPGTLATDCALVHATCMTLIAYYNRLRTGKGDFLDFSLLEGANLALDPGYGVHGSAMAGVPVAKLPRGRPSPGHQYPIFPCADGFARFCVLAPRQWQGLFKWMGSPPEFADPELNSLQARFRCKPLIPAMAAFFADKTRAEIEEQGAAHGVPAAGLLSFAEALESPHIQARKAFVMQEIAPGVTAPVPDGMFEIDGARTGGLTPAPALDADRDAIWADVAAHVPLEMALEQVERPCDGLKVLDFGVIVVGAESGRILADQGADVVKVESSAFPDGMRQNRPGTLFSASFASGHRNKRGLGINLRDPKGRDLILDMARTTDIVLSNYKPGTMESLGLDTQTLHAANPALIVVDSSAFGPTGPLSRRLGYGPLVRSSMGLSAEWRYADDPDSYCDAATVYPDHVAGRIGLIGVLALLIRRMRTGEGGSVSVAQSEVMLNHFAPRIALDALVAGGATITNGPSHDAPWGVYPAAGDDDWCVVTVRSDAEFQALCEVIQRPDLLALSTRTARDAARVQIDAAVTQWLATRNPHDAMHGLQNAGVPAAGMLRVSELPDFAFYQARKAFVNSRHPHVDETFYLERKPVISASLADPVHRPAPLLGEHSVAIVRERLGLAEDTVAGLVADGVLETGIA